MTEAQPNQAPASMARAKEVLRRHEESLLGKANVLGIGIGKEGPGCHLVALVSVKVPRNQLDQADLIPRSLDGVRVYVREIGDLSAQTRN